MTYKIGLREFKPVGRLGLGDEIILTCRSFEHPHVRNCSMCKRKQFVLSDKCAECVNTTDLDHFSPDPWLVESDLLFVSFCKEFYVYEQYESWKRHYYNNKVPVVKVDDDGIKRLTYPIR